MRWITEVAAAAAITAGITAGLAGVYVANAEPSGTLAVQMPNEDDPDWDCRTQGNRICGPRNSQLVEPGCYNDGGTLVALWPCHVVVNPDGTSDVYQGADPVQYVLGPTPVPAGDMTTWGDVMLPS